MILLLAKSKISHHRNNLIQMWFKPSTKGKPDAGSDGDEHVIRSSHVMAVNARFIASYKSVLYYSNTQHNNSSIADD